MTPAGRSVLRRLATGDALWVDAGGRYTLRPSGRTPGSKIVRDLIAEQLVSRPKPDGPLFGWPAEPGRITGRGLAAIEPDVAAGDWSEPALVTTRAGITDPQPEQECPEYGTQIRDRQGSRPDAAVAGR
jgi:hypothetical protein